MNSFDSNWLLFQDQLNICKTSVHLRLTLKEEVTARLLLNLKEICFDFGYKLAAYSHPISQLFELVQL